MGKTIDKAKTIRTDAIRGRVSESNAEYAEEQFYGIPGVKFIWHGANADPEVRLGNTTVDYFDLENAIYYDYMDDGGHPDDDPAFVKYVQDNADKVKRYIRLLARKGQKSECRSIKEGVSDSPYKEIIARHFDYSGDFYFLDIVAEVIDRIDGIEELDDDDINDEVYSSIDSTLVYYDDQWHIMRHYQTPAEANLDEAIDQLAEDCVEIAVKIKGSGEKEESLV